MKKKNIYKIINLSIIFILAFSIAASAKSTNSKSIRVQRTMQAIDPFPHEDGACK